MVRPFASLTRLCSDSRQVQCTVNAENNMIHVLLCSEYLASVPSWTVLILNSLFTSGNSSRWTECSVHTDTAFPNPTHTKPSSETERSIPCFSQGQGGLPGNPMLLFADLQKEGLLNFFFKLQLQLSGLASHLLLYYIDEGTVLREVRYLSLYD